MTALKLPGTVPKLAVSVGRISDPDVARAISDLSREVERLSILVAQVVNNNADIVAVNSGWANQTATASKANLGAAPTAAQISQWVSALDALLKARGILST